MRRERGMTRRRARDGSRLVPRVLLTGTAVWASLTISAAAGLAAGARSPGLWPRPPAGAAGPWATRGERGLLRDGTERTVLPLSAPEDTAWSAALALPGPDAKVTAAVVWNGTLVIAGQFSHIGAAAIAGVGQWDGVRWSGFGAGIPRADVRALAVWNGRLVVGGSFSTLRGQSHLVERSSV